ncbi:y+L amino acid transporter 2 [Caerostris extrusa]|uniref:Y+L amino acid transporter 2 n=1 Tax=Caerostris extrusa TaxID=172846 RepID=A0AAV4QHV6_CAEEX|nr:y+L amino acid transporter 2 [Caerostris extrusa]
MSDSGAKSPQNESIQLTPKDAQNEKTPATDVICLKPKMNLLNGITVIVGSIIGSGIFVSPKGVSAGCMITKTGADYAYIMESFGPFVAFLRLWVECMIVRPCSQAIVALTFSFYVLRPMYPDCDPPDTAIRFLACICICMIKLKIARNSPASFIEALVLITFFEELFIIEDEEVWEVNLVGRPWFVKNR